MKVSVHAIYAGYRNLIRHSKYRWWVIVGTLAYLLSPIDISPDVIPVLGQIDDVVLVSLLVSELSQVLIDWAKGRKGDRSVSDPYPTTAEEAVTVEAVPVEE